MARLIRWGRKKKVKKNVTFEDLRAFAIGELGWTLSRYRESTLYEFNLASVGYWHKWERNTAWLARELMFTMISLSPDIKSNKKPRKTDLMKLSIDEKPKKVDVKSVQEEAKEYEDKLKHGS